MRQEIDRRIQEKEEEFDHSKKNHARALDSMQASLEAEARAKEEALRLVLSMRSSWRAQQASWMRVISCFHVSPADHQPVPCAHLLFAVQQIQEVRPDQLSLTIFRYTRFRSYLHPTYRLF